MKNAYIPFLISLFLAACGSSPVTNNIATNNSKPASPAPTATPSKDGDYNAKGTVTKINLELGSVELDHEDIPGLMPPMKMEFYVSDKKMLDAIKLGDRVDFVLRYKAGTETVVKISKTQ